MLHYIFLIIFGIIPFSIGAEGFATGDVGFFTRTAFIIGITYILLSLFGAIKEKESYR